MLIQCGFFHFGVDHVTPTSALRRALDDAPPLEHSLIVLPEAFNIRKPYRGEGDPDFGRAIVRELRRLARTYGIAFIAGLVVNQPCGPNPPHSGAYLISSDRTALMCHKVGSDDTDGVNYTSRKDDADFQNPIDYGGLRIGALICVDGNPAGPVRSTLYARLRRVAEPSSVICILTHMHAGNFGNGTVGADVAFIRPWDDKIAILANSKPDGVASFITNRKGIVVASAHGAENKIVAVSFADL